MNVQGFPGGSVVKNPPANVGDAGDKGLIPESGRSPGEGNGNPFTPVFLPRESHGQRSLAGYSPQGRKESDTTGGTQHACTPGIVKTRDEVSLQTRLDVQ